MEHIADYYFEYIDDSEGLTPEVWISQYSLEIDEIEYFLRLVK